MFLTTRGRYAVMAMMDMVRDGKEGKAVSIKAMAERQNLSIYYLEQLFSLLKKHGIVHSIKGPGGGYTLGKEPADIFLLEILNAVGENIKITKCSDAESSACTNSASFIKCNAHLLWKDLGKYLEKYFAATSLLDIERNDFSHKRFSCMIKP